MNAMIFIHPHERGEAIEAYRDRLTPEQIDEIRDAPEDALVQLNFGITAPGTKVIVIEEG
jgi:hypothetical protein